MENAQHALSAGVQQGDSADVLNILSERLAKATQDVEKFQAETDKVNASRAAAEINKLSTAADNVDKAIIPQIAQIEQLKDKLAELDRAKAAGTTSRFGGDVDNAARVAIQNQLAALKESQAEAARYNQRLSSRSASPGAMSGKGWMQRLLMRWQTSRWQMPPHRQALRSRGRPKLSRIPRR
jgi:uncharacterized small protein (DUF1192 family)